MPLLGICNIRTIFTVHNKMIICAKLLSLVKYANAIKHFAIQNISGHKSKYLLSPVAILIELVVGSQSEQGADAHPV